MKGNLFLIIFFISTMISPANSKTISVQNANDAGSGSLREALSKAAPGDTIKFLDSYTIKLNSRLEAGKSVAIIGAPFEPTLDGQDMVQILMVEAANSVLVENIHLTRGNDSKGKIDCRGGGVENYGYLQMNDCLIDHCHAQQNGGGIHNAGTLRLSRTTIAENQAVYSGGGIFGDAGGLHLNLSSCTIERNTALTAGGLRLHHPAGFQSSHIKHNIVAMDNVAGIDIDISSSAAVDIRLTDCEIQHNDGHGIISNKNLIIDRCSITDNNGWGILMEEEHLDIRNSLIKSNQWSGIFLEEYCFLNMQNCKVENNLSSGIHAFEDNDLVIDQSEFTGNSAAYGGAVHGRFDIELYLSNSTFVNNGAEARGGAIYGDFEVTRISGCRFSGNVANFKGGALFLVYMDTCKIAGCEFSGNQVSQEGGAIYVYNRFSSGEPVIIDQCLFNNNLARRGGAFFNEFADAYITGCDFEQNAVTFFGGAVYNMPHSKIYHNGNTFTDNSADASGGAVFNGFEPDDPYAGSIPIVEFVQDRFHRNRCNDSGGAIYNSGAATVTQAGFIANFAAHDGGAVYHTGSDEDLLCQDSYFADNESQCGGGLYVCGYYKIVNTTFNNNLADYGGAIHNSTDTHSYIINSTFYGNKGYLEGGGIWNANNELEIHLSTFCRNYGLAGGGIWNNAKGYTLCNTIVCYSMMGNDYYGQPPVQNVTNIVTDGSLTGGWMIDPLLEVFQDNGGFTQTCALPSISPAIDNGTNAVIPRGVTIDQCHHPRINGSTVDIGAVECQIKSLVTASHAAVPNHFYLRQNYPNPFNASTTFSYGLPLQERIILAVYDIEGRLVEVLADQLQQPGDYVVQWRPGDLPSAVYFIHYEAAAYRACKKMVLSK